MCIPVTFLSVYRLYFTSPTIHLRLCDVVGACTSSICYLRIFAYYPTFQEMLGKSIEESLVVLYGCQTIILYSHTSVLHCQCVKTWSKRFRNFDISSFGINTFYSYDIELNDLSIYNQIHQWFDLCLNWSKTSQIP